MAPFHRYDARGFCIYINLLNNNTMPKVAKATKKAATKRKRKPKFVRALTVRHPGDEYPTIYCEGQNCNKFEYDTGHNHYWFKIYFDTHCEIYIGVPYSVSEPL